MVTVTIVEKQSRWVNLIKKKEKKEMFNVLPKEVEPQIIIDTPTGTDFQIFEIAQEDESQNDESSDGTIEGKLVGLANEL